MLDKFFHNFSFADADSKYYYKNYLLRKKYVFRLYFIYLHIEPKIDFHMQIS